MNLTATAQSIFANDIYATQITGIVIDKVDADATICSLHLGDKHRNAKGGVMGGVLFTLADFAFAVAANCATMDEEGQTPQLQWVSSSSTIHFLSAVKGDILTVTTTAVRRGQKQAVYQSIITDNKGCKVALVTTSGTRIVH